ncbi:MAG: hypothetical protein L6365_13525 [Desulfobulbaceae bacterium]|nr:hypothetical protein [Desulfobulbaceae bacterium]
MWHYFCYIKNKNEKYIILTVYIGLVKKMKIKKQYLIPAVLACAFVLMQNSFSIAATKSDVDEELSPYKWGHWDRMVPPAAGPVALAPAPITAALPSPDAIVPPPPPEPTQEPTQEPTPEPPPPPPPPPPPIVPDVIDNPPPMGPPDGPPSGPPMGPPGGPPTSSTDLTIN